MPTPVSREFLRGLKIKRDDEKRIEKMNAIVREIYEGAIKVAELCIDTKYIHDIDPQRTRGQLPVGYHDIHGLEYQFYKDNIEDIMYSLEVLFTDCSIKVANMCRGRDGKIYDSSTTNANILSLINKDRTFECIVIDWS